MYSLYLLRYMYVACIRGNNGMTDLFETPANLSIGRPFCVCPTVGWFSIVIATIPLTMFPTKFDFDLFQISLKLISISFPLVIRFVCKGTMSLKSKLCLLELNLWFDILGMFGFVLLNVLTCQERGNTIL